MKKSSQTALKLISIFYKVAPFFIGIYCYLPVFSQQENRIYPFLDAVYASLKLYSGTTESGIPVGGLLQFARFLAIAATLSIVIGLLDKVTDVINDMKLFNSDATVIYGDSDYADYIFKDLPSRQRIRGEGKFIDRAARYVLMFPSDMENLAFYNRNCEQLRDKNVYIRLEDISRQNIENPLITVFSIAENCARQYWKDYPVLQSEKIAIIGFENVGKNILLYGLQVNLIDPGQHFTYHIYGDGTEFRREHTRLDQMAPDEIIFHDSGSYEYAELLDFDRIIICGSENVSRNVTIAGRILAAVPVACPVYLYTPRGDIVTSLFGKGQIICFGTAETLASADVVFNERTMEAARRQHEFYCQQYGGTPWEQLDSFKRYSNVSSSDYMPTAERLMAQGTPPETLAELEHMRWCRYHYIHNWTYGVKTDSARRIHSCLVPYHQLSEEEKAKDIEAIKSRAQDQTL